MVKSRGEEEGPLQLSDDQLAILDGQAALEEIKKLHDLKVIEPCAPDPLTIPPEQLVDTILVNDWRFREERLEKALQNSGERIQRWSDQ